MRLSVIKKLLLSSAVLLVVLHPVNSLSAESDELRQKLDQLQKTLQGAAPDEPVEELEKRLQMLKELLNKEGITEYERQDLEERLKTLKGRLTPQEKPLTLIEEAVTTPEEKRFFIEGRYWLAYTEGGDKDVASLYNIDTKSIGNSLVASLAPTNAFVISAGHRHAAGSITTLKLWHLDSRSSLTRNATSTIGISGTEASNYYYQNTNQWGTGTFATKGADRVTADTNLNATNADIYYATPIGKGANKELGVALGLKYAQVDSDYEITYYSSPSFYNIKSNVENTLLGPLFGIYGKGSIFQKLSFNGFFDVALAWDHVRASRFEYDYNASQAAVPDVTRASDLVVAVIEGEMGIRYPFGQNLLFGLDYKTSYFNGLPFEFKPTASTLIDTVELLERDVLFHGLTAGISYSF